MLKKSGNDELNLCLEIKFRKGFFCDSKVFNFDNLVFLSNIQCIMCLYFFE